jgi:hypothetical protein
MGGGKMESEIFFWPYFLPRNELKVSGADLNYDCVVNFIDFAILADHWLEGI